MKIHGGKTASRIIRENQNVRVSVREIPAGISLEALAAGHDGRIEIEVDGEEIGVGGQHRIECL